MGFFFDALTERFSSKFSSNWSRLLTKPIVSARQCEMQQKQRLLSAVVGKKHLQDIICKQLLQIPTPKFQTIGQRPSGTTSLYCNSGDRVLDARISNWMEWDKNPQTKAQIIGAIKQEDWET